MRSWSRSPEHHRTDPPKQEPPNCSKENESPE
jgi:transcriptional regulator of acetoin/glycerol metabolism